MSEPISRPDPAAILREVYGEKANDLTNPRWVGDVIEADVELTVAGKPLFYVGRFPASAAALERVLTPAFPALCELANASPHHTDRLARADRQAEQRQGGRG